MIATLKLLAAFSPFIVCLFSFLGLFLKYRKQDKAKFLLALFMLAGSIYYFLDIIKGFNNPYKYCYLYVFHLSLLLIAVPQVYFYIRELTIGNPSTKRVIIHCLPAIIFFVIGNIAFFGIEPEQRLAIVRGSYKITDENVFFIILFRVFNLSFLLQLVGYYLYANKLLLKHKNELNHIFSDISGLELNWVKHFLWIMIVWCIFSNYRFMFFVERLSFLNDFKFIFDLIISVLIFGIYLFGTVQKCISNFEFTHYSERTEEPLQLNNARLKVKLLNCIEKKELYLKNDLTIWDLCREANSNRTYISNLINKEFGMNFNSFINKYRVDKAIKILENKEFNRKSLDDIAKLSGFNSLASFNRAFKKFVNIYPASFRNRVVEELA